MNGKVKKNEWLEWIQAIVIAIIIAFIIKHFFIEIIEVDGQSMYPTLQDKNRLLVNKIEYRINEPQIGDIVIFEYPENRDVAFIKRVVAKEGDTVEIKDHFLYINDEKIIEPYINYGDIEDFAKDFTKVKVPENGFFVLGDNRDSSKDSRFQEVGFLKEGDILGKAIFRLWPLNKIGRLQ